RGDAAKWIVHGLEESAGTASYRTILDETEAINTALDSAPDDSLVVILPESVTRAIDLIQARHPLPPEPSLNGKSGGNSGPAAAAADQYAEVHS
ncbi:MAG TPA: hypothetical protein VLS96_17165, partial [Nodosilinea sp.]|nr:hypothetical protein [Nodosilinea sp.]